MTDKILIKRDGPIALVTLNDSPTRNSLSPDMVSGLVEFLEGANDDDGLGCIVLTGSGDGFCSGGNIKDMQEGTDPQFAGTPDQIQEAFRAGIQKIPLLFNQLDVPAIAAVNGVAVGAGCDMTCMCDIRIGSAKAKFAESFLRVGLVSGDGGAWYLPRVVGYPRAIEMALTCRMIDAVEAKDWGLVTHVVEPDALLDAAMKMARTITSFPPRSARLNKRLMRKSMRLDLDECLELSAAYQAIVQHTHDQREAVAALVQKREPTFLGR